MIDTEECGCRYVGILITLPMVVFLLVLPWLVKYWCWVLN